MGSFLIRFEGPYDISDYVHIFYYILLSVKKQVCMDVGLTLYKFTPLTPLLIGKNWKVNNSNVKLTYTYLAIFVSPAILKVSAAYLTIVCHYKYDFCAHM